MLHVARAATAALLTLGATFTLTTVASPADAAPPSSGPDVVAHRGSSGAAPENTIAAIKLALDHRSDTVENDIQRTSDGELVIMHDVTLTRTTDVEEVFPDRAPWNVGDFTLAEIKRLDAGSWFAPEFAGQRVPTLEQWVKTVGRRAGMLLEPKSPELYPGIEQDLDKELRSLPDFNRALRAGKVAVQSFNHEWLRAYADLAPDVPVGLLYGTKPTDGRHRRRRHLGGPGQPGARGDRRGHRRRHPRRRHGDPRLDGQRRPGHAPRHQLGRRRHHHQLPAGAARHPPPRLTREAGGSG